jgi:hypothetical protein
MTPLFKKLNLGSHKNIVLLNAPDGFESEVAALEGVAVSRNPSQLATIPFLVAFVQTHTETALKIPLGTRTRSRHHPTPPVARWRQSLLLRPKFNRDTGWAAVKAAGFDSVRQVAIDEDWSALRFRRVEYIKS